MTLGTCCLRTALRGYRSRSRARARTGRARDVRMIVPAYNMPTEQRWAVLGSTAAGRLLYLVYSRRGTAVRIITARDADAAEKRRYRRK